MDDNKLSHKDPNIVTNILSKIEAKFPGHVITRGKDHVFLGIKFKFLDDQKVELNLSEYIEEAINESGLCIDQNATSPQATGSSKWISKRRKLTTKGRKRSTQ